MKKNKFVQSVAILTMVSGSLMTCPAVLANTVHQKGVAIHRVATVSAMRAKPIITANNFATTPSNNTSIKAVINYQYNGKTISSYTENVQPDASIDINSHLPQGYQTPNGYTPQANFPVQNGVATINVPVVPISTSNPDSGNINVTINYTYNGKTVGTGTETIASGSTIDVSKELPKGYQVSSEYKPSSDIPVQDGKATIEVPVTPTSSSSSNQGEKMVIDYVDANGNQVGTATVNVQSGQPVDVTKTLPNGYQLSPNFKPQANIPVVDGVATIKVQVVKSASSSSSSNESSATSDSSASSLSATANSDSSGASASNSGSESSSTTTDNSSSSSSTANSRASNNDNSSSTNASSSDNNSGSSVNDNSSSATTDNNSSASSTDNNSSSANGSSSAVSNDNGGNQKQDDDSSSSVASTDNGGNQSQDSDSSSSAVIGNVDNDGNQKQDDNSNNGSSSQNANSQSSSSDKESPTVSATEGVKDMKGDTNAKKINYTDNKGNIVKSVPTKNGKANSNDIQSNLPLGANLNGATVSKDSNGNLNVSLPQTGEKTQNSIIISLGTMLISLSGIIALWFKNKKNKNI